MELKEVIISSKRLRQIPITLDYAKRIFSLFSSDITTYMYPQSANDISETIQFINSSIKSMEDGTNLQLVILNSDTDEFLGCSGLHETVSGTPELGIWLKKFAHGYGYGIEAIGAIIEWTNKNIPFEYIKYPVDKRNYASKRIPEFYGGKIKSENKTINSAGFELDIVEYWIMPNSTK